MANVSYISGPLAQAEPGAYVEADWNDNLNPATKDAVRDQFETLLAVDYWTYKGVIDCSGTPDYPAGDAGDNYIISVAGKIGGASGEVVEVGDLLICNTDGTVTGDEAAVGTKWDVVQGNIDFTGAQIKTLYEAEADTNAYTDAELAKVGHISITGAANLDSLADGNIASAVAWNKKAEPFSGIDDPSLLAITYNATNRQFTVVNSGATISVNGTISTPTDETTAAQNNYVEKLYNKIYKSNKSFCITVSHGTDSFVYICCRCTWC